MTDTTLDAAIEAAHAAANARDGFPPDWREQPDVDKDRTYARALIAKLLEGMSDPEEDLYMNWLDGYNAALTEIRRRAGLEVGL
jgi:hypothetical protein